MVLSSLPIFAILPPMTLLRPMPGTGGYAWSSPRARSAVRFML
jgi:hypothetical protein